MKRVSFIIFAIVLLPVLAIFGADNRDKKILEYGILDYGNSPSIDPYMVRGNLFFEAKRSAYYEEKPELIYKLEPGYNKLLRLYVANAGKTPEKFKVVFKADETLMMGIHGSGGETLLELPALTRVSLPVNIFTQDAHNRIYRFSAEIKNEAGQTADIIYGSIYIKNPKPELEFKHNKTDGLFHTYTLKNKGDALHNFSVSLNNIEGYEVSPKVEHYLFAAGEEIELKIFPVTAVSNNQSGEIVFNASGRTESHSIDLNIPQGEQIFTVSMDPALLLRRKDWYCTNRPIIHMDYVIPYVKIAPMEYTGSAPAWLNEKINIVLKGEAYDTDNSGNPDHWELLENNKVIMSADDYDNDGAIDYLSESDANDRTLNRAYVKIDGKWNETNIVSAYLVSSSVPMNDYDVVSPHDVKILFNNKIVKEQKQAVPTGSSIVRLRLDQLKPPVQSSSVNRVTVSTSHLPGVHYQVMAANTLVIHFSTIDLPVSGKVKPEQIDTSSLDADIRFYEKIVRTPELLKKRPDAAEKLAMMKKQRDEIIVKVQKRYSEILKNNKAGIKSAGVDLGLFSSEGGYKDGVIYGVVRNLGYEGVKYKLTLEVSADAGPFKTVAHEEYPALHAFARRKFEFKFASKIKANRIIYRVKAEVLGRKDEEWITSNNSMHVILGGPPDEKSRRAEMQLMAKELDATNDQVTLSRIKTPEAIIEELKYGRDAIFSIQAHFSAPLSDMETNPRMFIIEGE